MVTEHLFCLLADRGVHGIQIPWLAMLVLFVRVNKPKMARPLETFRVAAQVVNVKLQQVQEKVKLKNDLPISVLCVEVDTPKMTRPPETVRIATPAMFTNFQKAQVKK